MIYNIEIEDKKVSTETVEKVGGKH